MGVPSTCPRFSAECHIIFRVRSLHPPSLGFHFSSHLRTLTDMEASVMSPLQSPEGTGICQSPAGARPARPQQCGPPPLLPPLAPASLFVPSPRGQRLTWIPQLSQTPAIIPSAAQRATHMLSSIITHNLMGTSISAPWTVPVHGPCPLDLDLTPRDPSPEFPSNTPGWSQRNCRRTSLGSYSFFPLVVHGQPPASRTPACAS